MLSRRSSEQHILELVNGVKMNHEYGSFESSSSSDSSDNNEQLAYNRDSNGQYLVVTCGEDQGRLYTHKFVHGSVGKCILYDNNWLTFVEFHNACGFSKDWKRTICCNGHSIIDLINNGVLIEHNTQCKCELCGLSRDGEMALADKRRRFSQSNSLHNDHDGMNIYTYRLYYYWFVCFRT